MRPTKKLAAGTAMVRRKAAPRRAPRTAEPRPQRFGRGQLRTLGQALQETRRAHGWSLKRLSSASKVSVGAIQRIEAGEASASLLTVAALAEALGTSMDRLVRSSLAAAQATRSVHAAIPRRFAGTLDVTAGLDAPRMRARVIALAARSSRLVDTSRSGESLFAYVIGGKLRLTAADGTVEHLTAGDAMHWSVPERMTWFNPLDRPMLALAVVDQRTGKGDN